MRCSVGWCIAESRGEGLPCAVHRQAPYGPLEVGSPLDGDGRYEVACRVCGTSRACETCDGEGTFHGITCGDCRGSGRCRVCADAVTAAKQSTAARYIESVFAAPLQVPRPFETPWDDAPHWTEAYR